MENPQAIHRWFGLNFGLISRDDQNWSEFCRPVEDVHHGKISAEIGNEWLQIGKQMCFAQNIKKNFTKPNESMSWF